jgi:hypothetical protein
VVPLKIRLAMVREVSVLYSMTWSGMPGMRPEQQLT